MIDPRLYDVFDDCLMRLKAGESISNCLRLYPDLAGDLHPLLKAAMRALEATPMLRYAQRRSRARLIAAAVRLRAGDLLHKVKRAAATKVAEVGEN